MAINDLGCELKKVAFTIDLSIPQVSCGTPGANGMSPFAVVIYNLSPFDANNVRLMLYTYSDGDQKPTLVYDQMIPRINRASVAAGTPGSTTVTGFIPAPSKDFKLIAAANVQYSPGGFTVSGVPGAWAADSPYSYQPTFNGQSPPGLGSAVAEPYLYNNVNISGTTAGAPGGGGGGGGGSNGGGGGGNTNLHNLKAQSVVYNKTTGQATATFTSDFPVGGWVDIRFYRQPAGSASPQQIGNTARMHIDAGATFNLSESISASDGDIILAAIDDIYSNGSWGGEKYTADDGRSYDESTYGDNVAQCVVGSPPPPPPPQAKDEVHPATYHPMKAVPRYETRTVPVYGWKKVPFIKDPATGKIRVRLIQ
ncbi:hypothetical protein [Neomoorella thermoacetica]|uniref:hypothetical protein n=1 Tax=Neomoorella thermoacetica TaxID=1525 RepID=UPI0015A6981E|nr:hypothetical protein [Moorella thermoacetica]